MTPLEKAAHKAVKLLDSKPDTRLMQFPERVATPLDKAAFAAKKNIRNAPDTTLMRTGDFLWPKSSPKTLHQDRMDLLDKIERYPDKFKPKVKAPDRAAPIVAQPKITPPVPRVVKDTIGKPIVFRSQSGETIKARWNARARQPWDTWLFGWAPKPKET